MTHAGSFKNHKNAFLNDPKCQKQGFLDLGLVDRLDIAYYDSTNVKMFQHLGVVTSHPDVINYA